MINQLKEYSIEINNIRFTKEPVEYSVIIISVALYVSTCVARSIYTCYRALSREMLKPGIQKNTILHVVNVMYLSLD